MPALSPLSLLLSRAPALRFAALGGDFRLRFWATARLINRRFARDDEVTEPEINHFVEADLGFSKGR